MKITLILCLVMETFISAEAIADQTNQYNPNSISNSLLEIWYNPNSTSSQRVYAANTLLGTNLLSRESVVRLFGAPVNYYRHSTVILPAEMIETNYFNKEAQVIITNNAVQVKLVSGYDPNAEWPLRYRFSNRRGRYLYEIEFDRTPTNGMTVKAVDIAEMSETR